MNRELLKTLVKDYDLPIMFYDEPYWSHFKDLYNPFIILMKNSVNE